MKKRSAVKNNHGDLGQRVLAVSGNVERPVDQKLLNGQSAFDFKIANGARTFCIFFLCALAVFFPVLHGGFFWDDKLGIIESLRVRESLGVLHAWIPWRDVDYWPLTYNAFWFLWRVGDGTAFSFHVFLLLTHIANTFLIWMIARELKLKWSFAVALVFLVHPVNAETVAWSLQIKTTLSTLLAYNSTFFWIRFVESNRLQERNLALLFFTGAMLAKTSVVTWPVVLAFIVWWNKGEIQKKYLYHLIPFFVVSLVLGIIAATHNDYSALAKEDAIRTDSFWGRLVTSGWALWFYLYKSLWPLEVNFMYPRWNTDASNITHWVPGVAWVLLTIGAFLSRRRLAGKIFLAVLFLYPVTLFPALGFVDIYFMKYSFVADHWQYQTIPIAIAAVIALPGRFLVQREIEAKTLLVLLILAMSWSSFNHAKLFRSEESVYLDTVNKNPSAWMAFNQLGNISSARNDFVAAEKYYKKSILIFPEHKNAIGNLGKLYLRHNRSHDALEQFQLSLKINEKDANAWADLCAANASLKRYDQAREQCLKSIAIDRSNFNALLNLGFVERRRMEPQRAVEAYEKALELKPTSLEAAVGLGLSFLQSGNYGDAEGVAKVILRNKPDHIVAKEILNEVALKKKK